MKTPTRLVHLIFVFLLAGCQTAQIFATLPEDLQTTKTTTLSSTPSISWPKITATPIETLTPTLGVTPEDSSIPKGTGTISPTATPAILSETRLQTKCLEVAPDLPAKAMSEGFVILESRGVTGTYRLDMATGKFTQFNRENEGEIYHSVSPNRKLLAYHNSGLDSADHAVQRELIISTVDGERLASIPWEKGWYTIAGWLDDQRLVINIASQDADESHALKAATLLALNPFTGERKILKPDFPDIYNIRPVPDWDGWSITSYDPSLSRLIYPKFTGEGYVYTYILWDLQKNQAVKTLEDVFTDTSGYLPVPRWSPDGSRLVVEGFLPQTPSFELFLVTRDGLITQLTNLDSKYKLYFLNYSWSPDGRYIAAWMGSTALEETLESELFVIDTSTRQVTNYCIRVKYGGEGYGSHLKAPIWSPDGRQLIVQDWYEKDHRSVILVDIVNGYAARIAEDMEPVGWMISP